MAAVSWAHAAEATYFPPPDSQGGWRTPKDADEARRVAGMDLKKLDETYEAMKSRMKNGGLLVVRHGWLVYEKYFGRGDREATPNLASCGKSFTSIAVGILMAEHLDLFPDGLDQKVFTPRFFPPEAFPLADPRMADIKLGQLLAFSAGIRGLNPGEVNGKRVTLDPPGPDGWQAMVDEIALGRKGVEQNGHWTMTVPLWCEPGGGYSYATSAAHLASMIVRHVSGMELEDFLRSRIAEPTGWGRFGFAYRNRPEITHTLGGGGIAMRATDVVRFCYLLLEEGRWNDRQIVPAEYVRQCGRQSPYNPHAPYSLQFDVNTDGHIADYPRDAYWKTGSGGHAFFIVPSLDLIVWQLAGRDDEYSEVHTRIPLPEVSKKPREDWPPPSTARSGRRRVLAMVIDAIDEPSEQPD